jgi:hypothetical protein
MTSRSTETSGQTNGLSQEIFNNARRIVNPFVEGLRGGVLSLLALTMLMWLANIAGLAALNIPFALIGIMAIGFVLTKPALILYLIPVEASFAWLRDEDVSQGAAGAIQTLSRAAVWILFVFSMNSILLTTWSFQENPGAFWMLELVIFTLALLAAIYGSRGVWTRRLSTAYLLVVTVALIWTTFGPAYNDQMFDAQNGQPLHMIDPATGKIDPLGRTPTECESTTCFSPVTGRELVPATETDALRRNPDDFAAVAIGKIADINLTSFGRPVSTENTLAVAKVDAYGPCDLTPQVLRKRTAYLVGRCGVILQSSRPIKVSFVMVGVDKFNNKPNIVNYAILDQSYRAPYGVAGVFYEPIVSQPFCIFAVDQQGDRTDAAYMDYIAEEEAKLRNADQCPTQL